MGGLSALKGFSKGMSLAKAFRGGGIPISRSTSVGSSLAGGAAGGLISGGLAYGGTRLIQKLVNKSRDKKNKM